MSFPVYRINALLSSLLHSVPVGTNLAATNEAAKQIEGVLANTGGVKTYQVSLGSGGDFRIADLLKFAGVA